MVDKELKKGLQELRRQRDELHQRQLEDSERSKELIRAYYSIPSRDRPQTAPQRYEWQPYPEQLRCIPCGASTRAGTPCKITVIFRNGRCKFHGGRSTGAKTRAGQKRQRDGYRAWLEKQRDSKAGRKRTREYTRDVARICASTLSEIVASETDRALQPVDGISLRLSGGTLVAVLPHGHSIAVTLTTTSPRYGGARWWYVCPDCGGRKASLYLHNESLCCRRCSGLHYASQSK